MAGSRFESAADSDQYSTTLNGGNCRVRFTADPFRFNPECIFRTVNASVHTAQCLLPQYLFGVKRPYQTFLPLNP